MDGCQQKKIVGLVELDVEPQINITTRSRDHSLQTILIYRVVSDSVHDMLSKLVGAYDLINDLTKNFSHISFLDLLNNSPAHRATILEVLGLIHLANITPLIEAQINPIEFDVFPLGHPKRDIRFVFDINKMPTDADIARRGDLDLFLQVWIYNNYVKCTMIDDGAVVNIVPFSFLQKLGYGDTN